jgi:protein-L-isoaspartate O-methyltransferase
MKTNIDIVDFLKEKGILKSKNIIDSFYHVDRKDFVLEEDKNNAYIDAPLSI